jgi:hypothetical protein
VKGFFVLSEERARSFEAKKQKNLICEANKAFAIRNTLYPDQRS